MFNNNISVSKNQKIDEENEILYKSGDTIIMKGEAKSSD